MMFGDPPDRETQIKDIVRSSLGRFTASDLADLDTEQLTELHAVSLRYERVPSVEVMLVDRKVMVRAQMQVTHHLPHARGITR